MNVSVALCTYNGEEYIEEQIESILDQTYDISEVVVFDDSSTDSTISKINKYANKYPQLFEVHTNDENVGVEENFARCIKHCKGDAIAISDQDDIWHEEKIEREVEALTREEVSLVFHNSTIVTSSLEQKGDLWSTVQQRVPKNGNQRHLITALTKYNFVQGCTILFDESLKRYLESIPSQWEYDYYIAVVAALTGGLHAIDDELLLYRQHEQQAIGSPEENSLERVRKWTQNSLARNRQSYHEKESRKWKNVLDAIDRIDSPSPDKNKIIEMKCDFERQRSEVYDPDVGIRQRIKTVVDCWNEKGYQRYTDAPSLHSIKDLFASFLVSVYSNLK
ncbi:glycosyltransferase [Natrinema gari]|uniref:Family 2 glycosyl transferase n=1 Tax=Natrinema gari JCM 14663 TaxID=1230459 RepID=L9YTV9_9EURY|nr:glycosyltransferase [Natrinema gari]ELY77554.1 family 2 glycosyl transferase [Natrinema gari JCM 14663]